VTEPLLIVEDLVGGYVPEVDILKGVNLTLQQGELVGIIGPNGAGKSTLVKAIFGLLEVRSGTVSLRGDDITGQPTHELVSKGMGYVPQRANVFPSLSVEDNLRMGLYLNMGAWAERFEAIAAMFPIIQQRRHQKAGLLSGGERQMVAFGRALMTAPSVMLLDEPSAGLSPMMQDRVFEKAKEIAASGVSVVMVEQNARHCLGIADRGYVLDQGRNAYTGTGEELLNDPKVIDLYLGTLGLESGSRR
jgi:branched-chain amino acid transport system ATP-binding protein